MEQITSLFEKFNNFKDASFRSIAKTADGSLVVTLVVQDDEGDDIHSVKIEFIDINDARLLDNATLPYLDMMSGVSLIKDHNLFAFAIGNCDALLHVKNAPFYIVSADVNIEEAAL